MRTTQGAHRAAVLGSPIAHSVSPALHRAAYDALGLSGWTYDAVRLDEDTFGPWFTDLGPDWSGLSLTMPLKRVVIPLLAEVTPLAEAVGAVNTVTWTADRRPVGTNTDVYGIVQALRSTGLTGLTGPAGSDSAEGAGGGVAGCVVGAGATAASAVAALAELGCGRITVLARSAARAGLPLEVARRMGVRARVGTLDEHAAVLGAHAVVVTLPGEAASEWAAGLRPHLTGVPAGAMLDVSYHPWPTDAAQLWSRAGGAAVGGFEMLLHQAAEQVRLMTGLDAPLDDMRTAGEKALAAR
ncbi:shikimate dehydrogenase [Kineosporia sp. J2-2]|uniref:Shikimate dehydrogenase n=1 Tax=Kineosporia corallincola TaxID=2835133 RepID=A0ABS5TFI5_9ACTN|nr:shikimate dehydrogenase [Kineosporia corallincola]MBT0768956.1 shikimate dehydrogenase [Kineosporia corallincola]